VLILGLFAVASLLPVAFRNWIRKKID
jgi:hypothetical protein